MEFFSNTIVPSSHKIKLSLKRLQQESNMSDQESVSSEESVSSYDSWTSYGSAASDYSMSSDDSVSSDDRRISYGSVSSDDSVSSEESDSKELFDFYCIDHSQSDLFVMKQDGFFQNRKPRRFSIRIWDDHEDYLRNVLELFLHFHKNGIVWEELKVHDLSKGIARSFVHEVNTMNIFKKMKWNYRCWKGNIDFCPWISLNNFTEELTIVSLGRMSSEICLSLNNLLQANIPSFQKLELRLVLEPLHFHTHLSFISSIVSSAAKNPYLESLHMRCYKRLTAGDLSPEAIKTLLSVSTPLRKLSLCWWQGPRYEVRPEFIFEGFNNRLSLKRVDVHDDNLMFFFIPLSIWPQLMTKVKRDKPEKDQASDIYNFLKGPALAARTSFGKTLD